MNVEIHFVNNVICIRHHQEICKLERSEYCDANLLASIK